MYVSFYFFSLFFLLVPCKKLFDLFIIKLLNILIKKAYFRPVLFYLLFNYKVSHYMRGSRNFSRGGGWLGKILFPRGLGFEVYCRKFYHMNLINLNLQKGSRCAYALILTNCRKRSFLVNITFSHILCSPSLYMNVSMFIKFYRRPSRQFVRIHEAKETCVVGYSSIVPCITVFSQGLAWLVVHYIAIQFDLKLAQGFVIYQYGS